ncbi:MAG: hypothetical protein COY69_01870 [Candidatus Magasanikbacteria bacterium CG_4_10_14_0_8_um_filter_32_14]|uniref:Disintegrin domain-containing protein n=1 Tax=Candidatus Magasanikbacteria bacterium CG_4_10_14_0_8_um_filter_32_14 TaxID=1974640 RepID=A0A2M7R9F0_9BACT|nr:MAG: hypothetical protein COY69_01870 [Candidatus Magasanikbacteria bacterium CG_4_10_14_0_8_um_filter_32_14]
MILAAYAITNFVFSNVISGSGGPSTPRGGPLQIDVNCGNGVLDSGEPCDDNGNIGNGCKIDCTVESGWTCAPDPSFPGTSSCTRTGTGVVGSLCPNGNECLASLNCNSSTKKCEVANSDPAPQKWCLPTGGTCHQVTGDCPTGEVPYDFIATCKSNEVSVSPVGCYCTNENDVAVLGGGEKFFDYSSEECATRIDIQSISGGSGCTYK